MGRGTLIYNKNWSSTSFKSPDLISQFHQLNDYNIASH
jgi:hypothetical protein